MGLTANVDPLLSKLNTAGGTSSSVRLCTVGLSAVGNVGRCIVAVVALNTGCCCCDSGAGGCCVDVACSAVGDDDLHSCCNAVVSFLVGQRRHKNALYWSSLLLQLLSWEVVALCSCAAFVGAVGDFVQTPLHLGEAFASQFEQLLEAVLSLKESLLQ